MFTLILFIVQKNLDIEPFAHFANISEQELGGYFEDLKIVESHEPFGVYLSDEVDVDSLVLSR